MSAFILVEWLPLDNIFPIWLLVMLTVLGLTLCLKVWNYQIWMSSTEGFISPIDLKTAILPISWMEGGNPSPAVGVVFIGTFGPVSVGVGKSVRTDARVTRVKICARSRNITLKFNFSTSNWLFQLWKNYLKVNVLYFYLTCSTLVNIWAHPVIVSIAAHIAYTGKRALRVLTVTITNAASCVISKKVRKKSPEW